MVTTSAVASLCPLFWGHYLIIYPVSRHPKQIGLDLGESLLCRSMCRPLHVEYWPLNVLSGFAHPSNSVGSSVSSFGLLCNRCHPELFSLCVCVCVCVCVFCRHRPSGWDLLLKSISFIWGNCWRLLRCYLWNYWQMLISQSNQPSFYESHNPVNLRMLVAYTSPDFPVHLIRHSFPSVTNRPNEKAHTRSYLHPYGRGHSIVHSEPKRHLPETRA